MRVTHKDQTENTIFDVLKLELKFLRISLLTMFVLIILFSPGPSCYEALIVKLGRKYQKSCFKVVPV